MKEFLIEDFTIENDNSVKIEYYFYSEYKEVTYTNEEVRKVFIYPYEESYDEWLRGYFEVEDCIKLLTYYIREYKDKRRII